ncbi:YHS domain-containing protein [Roseovarius sp. LXJ103]|uniref:YHS domain-containing (seleno)protein n=1 Tax=Roseovarius carneus TaxID=2853164 RepID=UPI000D615103|nr:YHS domain-containing (seleno)protein [Roseovarius carneus]MBZ8117223.1 YHS domain-containing protein [Roseovarius carneus]PWE36946.1 YHS domain protein [Pelagicola sp. LXJ1103]
MTTRRTFLTSAAAMATIAATTTLTALPAFAAKDAYYIKDGTVIGGYDPVAYFTDGGPAQGSAEHALDWDGATWHFTSAENKAAFKADPAKYAPQYGGYCAYAVSKGATAKTEPEAWKIVDDKLYLNFDLDVQKIWLEDVPGNITKADANWPGVLN